MAYVLVRVRDGKYLRHQTKTYGYGSENDWTDNIQQARIFYRTQDAANSTYGNHRGLSDNRCTVEPILFFRRYGDKPGKI